MGGENKFGDASTHSAWGSLWGHFWKVWVGFKAGQTKIPGLVLVMAVGFPNQACELGWLFIDKWCFVIFKYLIICLIQQMDDEKRKFCQTDGFHLLML
jgi:hypothetical protein